MNWLLLLLLLVLPKLFLTQIPTLVIPIGHVNPIRTLALSPNGKYVLSGDETGLINLWLAATGENIFTQQYTGLQKLSFSADSTSFMAIGTQSATLFDLFTQDTIHHVKGSEGGWYNGTTRSADEQLLFASNQNLLYVWSLESDTRVSSRELPTYDGGIFHQGKEYLLTPNAYEAERDTLFLIDAESDALLHALENRQLRTISKNEFLEKDRSLLTQTTDRTIRVWDLNQGTIRETFKKPTEWGYNTLRS